MADEEVIENEQQRTPTDAQVPPNPLVWEFAQGILHSVRNFMLLPF